MPVPVADHVSEVDCWLVAPGCKPGSFLDVAGSIPARHTVHRALAPVAEPVDAPASNPGVRWACEFDSRPEHGPLAQLAEHPVYTRHVGGSSPSGTTQFGTRNDGARRTVVMQGLTGQSGVPAALSVRRSRVRVPLGPLAGQVRALHAGRNGRRPVRRRGVPAAKRVHGATGSAPALQAGGCGFESHWIHATPLPQ